MKESKRHSKHSTWFNTVTLWSIMVLGVWTLSMPACVHDSFPPIDPGPIDTTGHPIDTMDVDTMDEDTFGIPCNPDSVYFSRDILPLLVSNCAKSGCHDAISHKEDIILDNYQNVMASDVVKAYNLSNSDLYESITETEPDKRMPEPPNEKLTTDQIDIIAKWILQGAKDLSCDEMVGGCDTTFVSYSTFVSPVLKTYCVGCHSGVSPSGNISDCKINKIKAWINDGAQNN
jgi:Planctomycete cytochrome C